jgi:sigma-B regulation protein RsbU (phosphoserine phosphatase)
MDPAKEVGGDFYDFFEVDETHIALTIADVAGKGVPGALYMMSVLSVLRGKTQPGKKPSEILADINSVLVKGDFGDMFVTVWLGIVDLETGIITAANAGHEYPAIKQPGRMFELYKDKHGFVLGGMQVSSIRNMKSSLKRVPSSSCIQMVLRKQQTGKRNYLEQTGC